MRQREIYRSRERERERVKGNVNRYLAELRFSVYASYVQD